MSVFIPLHVIALKQGVSLNPEHAAIYRLVQTCLAFYVGAMDLNSVLMLTG